VLFPFGFGLSYTTFRYDFLNLSAGEIGPQATLRVSVGITNTGQRAGQEVVQLYVCDKEASVQRPEKELKAFAKVHLEPGESRTVTLTIARDALAYYDIQKCAWVAEAGEFELLIGSSSQDIRLTKTCTLTESSSFGGPARNTRLRLSLDKTLGELLDNPAASAILSRHIPIPFDAAQLEMVRNWRLEQIAGFVPQLLTSELLQSIARDLEGIEA
jgi:beta-glucosidase